MKNALVLIDYQNDFCHKDGSLFVPKANVDVNRICEFIRGYGDNIDYILASMDSHQAIDIAHSSFWVDKDGNNPPPFTQIVVKDVLLEVWSPVYHRKDVVIYYLNNLENKGAITHTIWPDHCVISSWGWELDKGLMQEINLWGGHFETSIKGTNPLTEHYGMFGAEVAMNGAGETLVNLRLLSELSEFDKVYVAGEAKSHCVATSIKQMLDSGLFKEGQIVILEDTMSPVPGFENISDDIYAEAKERGCEFSETTDYVFTL